MPTERSSASRPGLVVPVRTDATGESGPTRKQARGPRWRRTSQGYYVPAATDSSSVEQRVTEASVLVPPGGAITGWASLRWRGGRWFDDVGGPTRRPITVVVSTHDVRPQSGVAISGKGLRTAHVEVVDGVPLTTAAYAVSFEMRYAPSLWAAVRVLDLAAYDDLVSVEELRAFTTPGQNGWTGVPRAREATLLARENCWSPRESDMRWVWTVVAGLGAPLCNAPVFGLDGRHLGTPDLIDPRTGLVGEYEGGVHLDGVRRGHDVHREAVFRSRGLEPVVMVGADSADPERVAARLREGQARAAARPASERTWSLAKPPWWVPTESVAQRRALNDYQRRRYLAYRRVS